MRIDSLVLELYQTNPSPRQNAQDTTKSSISKSPAQIVMYDIYHPFFTISVSLRPNRNTHNRTPEADRKASIPQLETPILIHLSETFIIIIYNVIKYKSQSTSIPYTDKKH